MSQASQAIARTVSIVAHPFVLTMLLVAVSASRLLPGRDALTTIGTVLLLSIAPIWWFSARKVSRGEWSHIDATRRGDRTPLYLLGLACVGAVAVAIQLLPGAAPMMRGVIAGGIMILAGAVMNRWLKASLHVAFAGFTGVTLLHVDSRFGIAVLCTLPLLIWSRLALQRHTPAEVAAGVVLGVVPAAIVMAF